MNAPTTMDSVWAVMLFSGTFATLQMGEDKNGDGIYDDRCRFGLLGNVNDQVFEGVLIDLRQQSIQISHFDSLISNTRMDFWSKNKYF